MPQSRIVGHVFFKSGKETYVASEFVTRPTRLARTTKDRLQESIANMYASGNHGQLTIGETVINVSETASIHLMVEEKVSLRDRFSRWMWVAFNRGTAPWDA